VTVRWRNPVDASIPAVPHGIALSCRSTLVCDEGRSTVDESSPPREWKELHDLAQKETDPKKLAAMLKRLDVMLSKQEKKASEKKRCCPESTLGKGQGTAKGCSNHAQFLSTLNCETTNASPFKFATFSSALDCTAV